MGWAGYCALEQKKCGCLGSAMSWCSLEGGDMGHLERLGEHTWLDLLGMLAANDWYESGVYDWQS